MESGGFHGSDSAQEDPRQRDKDLAEREKMWSDIQRRKAAGKSLFLGDTKWLFDEVERLTAERRFMIGESALLTKQLGELDAEHDKELGRWQDEIYKLTCDLAPDAQIDGGGCDSGDPLDLTLDEISQAFSHWDNLLF